MRLPGPAVASVAGIAQFGDDNDAATFQLASAGALSATLQIGDFNTSGTVQSGVVGVAALTAQNGQNNTATTTQNLAAGATSATIQNGNNNSANTDQTGTWKLVPDRPGRRATLEPPFHRVVPRSRRLSLRPATTASPTSSRTAARTVRPCCRTVRGAGVANPNIASVTQRGSGNNSLVIQSGRGNVATVIQN